MKIIRRIFFALLVICLLTAGAGFAAYYFLPQAPKLDRLANDAGLAEDQTYNILCCGVDATRENADTILLVSFNPGNHSVKILSLPRDTMSNAPRQLKKLNASYSQNHPEDIEQTKREVEMLTGLHIDRYAVTTFDGFKHAIDAIGGVEMNVPEDLYYIDPYQNLEINIKAGQQLLDGTKSLQFVRYRAGYSEGDLGRIKAQHLFFKALGESLLNPSNVTKIPALAEVVRNDMKTDLTVPELLWFAKQARGINLSADVKMFMLPGTPDYIDDLSYFIPAEEFIIKMVNNEFLTGGKTITAADLNLVPLAKGVQPTYGYGSQGSETPPNVDAAQSPAPAEASPSSNAPPAAQAPPNQANYGYGGAYTPPAETNTNQPARSYTTFEQPRPVAPQPQPQPQPQPPVENPQPQPQPPANQGAPAGPTQ